MAGIEDILMGEGFQAVTPDNRGSWVPVSVFNPVTSPIYNKEVSRNTRVQDLVKKINSSSLSTSKVIGQGSRKLSPDFYTPNNNQSSDAVKIFKEFMGRAKNPDSKHNSYIAFDIETMGDRLLNKGEGFGVTEIAAQGFTRQKDGTYKSNGKSVFSALLSLDNKSATEIQRMIKQVKTDPYSFRRMTSSQQRSIVDLMRYSTINDGGVSGAVISSNRGITNISHNSVINQILTSNGTIDDNKFIQNFEYYLRHIQQGFDDLQSNGEKNHLGVINRYNKFIHENRYKYFLSHNGTNFDIPALEQWSSKFGTPIQGPKKHIDFLRVIQATDPNLKGLHTSFGRDFKNDKAYGGLGTLQEIRRTLNMDQSAAHNAMHDIGEEGLGGAFSRMFNGINKTINDSYQLPGTEGRGFNYHPPQLSWNDRYLKRGDTLFSVGGSRAYGNSIDDFQAIKSNGAFNAEDPDFNRQAINSKSFYEVQGIRNISDYNADGTVKTNRLALDLFDKESSKNSFIVREGDNALSQIEEFVQRKFYNWSGLTPEMRREVRLNKENDLARRRYDNMFSISGAGGNSTTKGFEAAKRMYGNAEVYQQRVQGKDSHINKALDRLDADSTVSKKQMMDRRISHQEMLSKMNFDSLPGGQFNETEQKLFFRMAPRLVDELPQYGQALKKIEKQYPITPDMSTTQVKSVKQKRDIAWRLYSQEVNNNVGGDTTKRSLQSFEQRGIHYKDRLSRLGTEKYLNFETMESARNSIYSQLGRKGATTETRKERMTNLIMSLQESNVINREAADQFHGFNRSYAINDSVNMMINELMDNHNIMQQQIEIRSVGRRTEMAKVGSDINQRFIGEAINKTNGVQGMIMQQGVIGGRVGMTEDAENLFRRLDKTHASKLNPNNYSAVNHILESYRTTADKIGLQGLQFAMSMNQEGTQARIQIYKSENSSSVVESFLAGKSHEKAAEITVPLIQQNGTHVIGNQVLNARSFMVNEGAETKVLSSAEMIARGYTDSREMRKILKAVGDNDFDEANTRTQRILRNEVDSLSGIKRNVTSASDGYNWANNDSDFLKQSHISLAPAMIDEWHAAGRIDLERDVSSDQIRNALARGNGDIRKATFSDLSPNKAYEMLKEVDQWAAGKGMNVYAGSVKSENVSKGVWSMQNIQDYHPMGAYSFNGRDNAVQWFNTYNINEQSQQRLMEAGIKPSYFNDLVTTQAMQERREQNPGQRGVNMKMAYMSQGQLDDRIAQLMADTATSDKVRAELSDPILKARLYEQQAIFTKEFMNAFKVDNHSFIDKGDQFIWDDRFTQGHTSVNPGDYMGMRTTSGYEEKVFYQGNRSGHVFTGLDENRIGIQTSESPFKFMIEGEKATDTSVSRETMRAITGSDDVMGVYNPNVAKHKDFGAMMTGQAKLLADHINDMNPEDQARALRTVEESNLGLKWNNGSFVTNASGDITADDYDRVFRNVGLNNTTSTGLTTAIQEVRASQVQNYSRMSDGTGQVVLGFNENGDPIHAPGTKGVRWGHREYGVLDNIGAEATKEYMYNQMLQNSESNGRVQETRNMGTALKSFIDPESIEGKVLTVNDFKRLPELGYNKESMIGTIFDQQHVNQLLDGNAKQGYWMELPKVAGLDYTYVDSVHKRGGEKTEVRKTMDKIFIPFTRQEGKGDAIYLRDLQNKISDIYRKASSLGAADGVSSLEEARDMHFKLQSSIDRYVGQLAKDVTASSGQTYSSVFKTDMNTSGTGIFKLIDPKTSDALQGEHTFISPEDARKLGVYDRLSEGKETYTMNVRYPTFHDNAMQVTKLGMKEGIKPGEFHVTALTSMLMKADSDGDYDNIVTLQDDKIQDEWKRIYDQNAQERSSAIEKLNMDYDEDRSRRFGLSDLNEDGRFSEFAANDRSELTAKSGKMVIGHASNLNYAMRQIAKTGLAHDETARNSIYNFGQDLEQKLISSKHGASEIDRAMDFINTVYSASNENDWKKVYAYDEEFLKGGNTNAIRSLQQIRNTEGGLRNPYTKFGTSSGVDIGNVGVGGLNNMIYGEGGQSNSGLGMLRNVLGVDQPTPDINEPGFRYSGEDTGFIDKAKRRVGGLAGLAGEAFEDMTGGMMGERVNSAMSAAMEDIFNGAKGPRNKKILAGVGVALAGLIGYNTLSDDEPVIPYDAPYSGMADSSHGRAPTPAISGLPNVPPPMGGASISVSAQGTNQNPNALSGLVGQAMQQSNYSGGKINMSVNHQDNTSKLNRNWYRDKVEQYV